MHVVCWKDGYLELARRVPRGAMPVIAGHGKRLRRALVAAGISPDMSGRAWVSSVAMSFDDLGKMYAVKGLRGDLERALAALPCRRRGTRLL